MHADPQLQRQIATPQRAGLLAIGLMVVFLLTWILAVYWRTTYSMVAIWERSETFAHGFVVIPIFLYLLWRDRDHLATIDPKPFFPALLGVVAMGALWLVGDRLTIVGAMQLAMIAMIPLACGPCSGRKQ